MELIFRIRMKGKSFVLNPLEEEQIVFLVNENTIDLWHKRLGHYHHQGLLQMKAKELVSGLPNFDGRLPHCKACQLGKKIRKPFPKSKGRATKMLQLMHTDVVGPQRTTVSLSGSLYYVIFIDDFTRMCWIFFMKHKSEVAQIFWKFKIRVENESCCKIQTIRSDNGKEYTSATFNKFCKESGIHHQLIAPYTP